MVATNLYMIVEFWTYHNQKNWCVEELVAQEIQVLAVESLNYSTYDN